MVDTKKEMRDLGIEPIDPPSQAKSKSTGSSKSKSSRPTDLTINQLEKALESQLEILGLLVSGFDTYDGSVITNAAPELAEKFIDLAKTHKPFRDFLEKLVATGTYSALIALIGGEILLPISVHHGWLPEPVNSVIAESREIPVKDKQQKDGDNDDQGLGIRLVSDARRKQEADETAGSGSTDGKQ